MRLKITVDIFSGRENPVIEISGEEAEEAIDRLQPVRRVGEDSKPPPSIPTCGYRGLIIETVSRRKLAGFQEDSNSPMERCLAATLLIDQRMKLLRISCLVRKALSGK